MMRKMVIFIYGSLLATFLLWTVGCAGSSQTVAARDQAATVALTQSDLSSPAPVTQDDNVPRIKAEEAIKARQAKEAVIIDTRDESSFVTMHIKGALNIPYKDFQDGKNPKLPKDKKLIFYCT